MIEHLNTKMHLHSHKIKAPVTDNEDHNEVSAYGGPDFAGDTNDYFRIQFWNHNTSEPNLKAHETEFQLIHVNTGCPLFSHLVKLPDWGFHQQEVTCPHHTRKSKSIWSVEWTTHPAFPRNIKIDGIDDEKTINYKNASLLSKFFSLHKFYEKDDDSIKASHFSESTPDLWPLLERGTNVHFI